MNSILEILYEALEPTMETPEERAAYRTARDALDKACPGLTDGEVDELWGAMMDACGESERTSFRWGLRLGLRLMLEGLGPADFTCG